MGLNFRKSISLGHGMKINLSKSGPSFSFGKKGLRQTISATGKSTTTVGLPGTGVYYTKSANVKSIFGKLFGKKKDKKAEEAEAEAKAQKAEAAETEKAAPATEKKASKASKAASGDDKQVVEFQEYCEAIRNVHRTCDDTINWKSIRDDELPAGIKVGTDAYDDWKTLNEFSSKVLDGDIDAYLAVVEEMKPFEDLLEYGSNFEVGTDSPDSLSIEFCVKSDEVVPTSEPVLLASGEVSEKELSKTAYFDLLQDYVCSTAIRVARDTFALLPVETCYVHAVDTVLNPATGNDDEVTILSVEINKERLASINMDRIDPSDALAAMNCNMKFKKGSGFSEVKRING